MNKAIFLKIYLVLVAVAFSALFVSRAHGAILEFLPGTVAVDAGKEFSVNLIIDSEDEGINAAQGTIRFSPDLFEAKGVSRDGSVFNFWVEEPTISNEEGTIRFLGGTSKGVSGGSLHVLRAVFLAKSPGSASITLSDGAVTASDGKGTNVLSVTKTVEVGIGGVAAPPPPSPRVEAPPREEPKPVVRIPVPTGKIPEKPVLRVPLYPDESRWYNHRKEVVVLWDVPNDVTQVAVAVDHNKNTAPSVLEKELLTGKNIGTLAQGVNYVHVRFRNALGFGETAHYRIAIDTAAPLPFEIEMETTASDDPFPLIRFATFDELSGVARTRIVIDGITSFTPTSTVLQLPLQAPGMHRIVAKIFDEAGNSVEDDLEFDIAPLAEPRVDFFTQELAQGEPIFASVQTIPNVLVRGEIVNENNESIFQGEIMSDALGNAELILNALLPYGKYRLRITIRDERGATSFPKEVGPISAKAKVVLSLGVIDLGWFEIFLLVFFIFLFGGGALGLYYESLKRKRGAYRVIVGRDIQKFRTLLESALKEIETLNGSGDNEKQVRKKHFIDQMKSNLEKMNKYLEEEVSRLE